MQFTLVRHGESTSNAAGIWQGQRNAALSDRGRAQAARVAERLTRGPRPDLIVSSDLRRAHATALAVADALDMPVEVDPTWREIDLGTWEGLTRDQVHARFPDEVAALARGEDVPVGGGERWSDVARRVRGAYDALRARHLGQSVLLVAHGGVIITLLGDLLGVDPAPPRVLGKLTNTAISALDHGDDGVRLRTYNDALHVDEHASWRGELGGRKRRFVAITARRDAGPTRPPGPFGPGLTESSATPATLAAWADGLLGPGVTAVPPADGARCLSSDARPTGTLWSWNEGDGDS